MVGTVRKVGLQVDRFPQCVVGAVRHLQRGAGAAKVVATGLLDHVVGADRDGAAVGVDL